jgi:hypothetical protein
MSSFPEQRQCRLLLAVVLYSSADLSLCRYHPENKNYHINAKEATTRGRAN